MMHPFKERINVRFQEPDFIIVCSRNRRVITISNRLHYLDRQKVVEKARSLHRSI